MRMTSQYVALAVCVEKKMPLVSIGDAPTSAMKLRRVFHRPAGAGGTSSPWQSSHSSSSVSVSASAPSRVQWINRILLLIGVATFTADLVFFWWTTDRHQALRLQRRNGPRKLQQPPPPAAANQKQIIKALEDYNKPIARVDDEEIEERNRRRRRAAGGGPKGGRNRNNNNNNNMDNNNMENNERPGRFKRNKQPKQQRPQFMSQELREKYQETHAEILAVFDEAGIALTEDELQEMPTWQQVVNIYGAHPVLVGVPDHCQVFQEKVPAVERMIGSAGMFNTGTNLVTQLLKENCKIPERVEKYGINATREAHGIRWQVPWGKHTPAHFRKLHATKQASAAGIDKDAILPVITTRDPYEWMKSMCRNPYTVKWPHHDGLCPHLTFEDGSYNPVHVKYANDRSQDAQSLAHLWNDWYRYYYNVAPKKPTGEEDGGEVGEEGTQQQRQAEEEEETMTDENESSPPHKERHGNQKEYYPWIMVRMEDLIFHAKKTITQVCTCIGGVVQSDRPFTYIVDSAKCDSPGHDCSTGMATAWIKYGGRRRKKSPLDEPGWRRKDYQVAQQVLDAELMEKLHYRHPDVLPF